MKSLIWLVGIIVVLLVAVTLLWKTGPSPSLVDCAFKEYQPDATFTVPADEAERCPIIQNFILSSASLNNAK